MIIDKLGNLLKIGDKVLIYGVISRINDDKTINIVIPDSKLPALIKILPNEIFKYEI